MTNFEKLLREFDDTLYTKDLGQIKDLTQKMFEELCYRTHCEGVSVDVCEVEENYLYKSNNSKIIINISIIKHFQKFAHLFLLDTLFIIIRMLMQKNFKKFLKEREENEGRFFEVKGNDELPLDFKDIFRLNNVMLMYCEMEKDKDNFYSLTMFDRRAFSYACMENYIKLVDYKEGVDYLKYLKEDFVLSEENTTPDTAEQLEDKIVSKYKNENQLGFLEEMELREQIFRQIENVLGE